MEKGTSPLSFAYLPFSAFCGGGFFFNRSAVYILSRFICNLTIFCLERFLAKGLQFPQCGAAERRGALGLAYSSGQSSTHGANKSAVFKNSIKKRQLPQRSHGGLRVPFHMDSTGVSIHWNRSLSRQNRRLKRLTKWVIGLA